MIYWRQKVVLGLLERAPRRSLERISLVKLLFLLRYEGGVGRYGSFYDFFPYKYGPFSYLLYRDVAELIQGGAIRASGNALECVSPTAVRIGNGLSAGVLEMLDKFAATFCAMLPQEIVAYVYRRFPWYASRSEWAGASAPSPRGISNKAVRTLGYEGLSVDSFLDGMLRNGIQTVIDVRYNAFSRKYGFSKRSLLHKCIDVGLAYRHFPEVGIPPDVRRRSGEASELWGIYRDDILPRASEAIRAIGRLCQESPSLMFCFERDPRDCHRSILSEYVSRTVGLPVVHGGAESTNA